MVAAVEGGIWGLWAPGKEQELLALDPRKSFFPWNQDIGQLWATSHKTPDFVGDHGACRRRNPNLQSEGEYLDFFEFSCLVGGHQELLLPVFGRDLVLALCSPVLCCLLSSQPALRSSRDTPTSLFHVNISFQAPAFAFCLEEILCLFHVLSLLYVCVEQTHLKPEWENSSGALLIEGTQVSSLDPSVSIKKIGFKQKRNPQGRLGLITELLTEGISDLRLSSDSWNRLQLPRRNQQEWSGDKWEPQALHAGCRFSPAALLFKYFL